MCAVSGQHERESGGVSERASGRVECWWRVRSPWNRSIGRLCDRRAGRREAETEQVRLCGAVRLIIEVIRSAYETERNA